MSLCLVVFHSVRVWEFKIAVSKKAITTKIKVYFEIGDIALAVENLWPLGRIIGVKPNKKDRVVRRVGPKFRSLESPIDKVVPLEASQLHESTELIIYDFGVSSRLREISLLL